MMRRAASRADACRPAAARRQQQQRPWQRALADMASRQRQRAATRWSLAGMALVATILTGVVLPGCLFLAPDADEVAGLQLRLVAQAPRGAATATAHSLGAPCPTPSELLSSDRLEGRARVYELAGRGRRDLLVDVPLTVGPYDAATGTRTLTGDVHFPLGPAGSSYAVEARLLALGTTLQGTYAGRIVLASGLEATVERFDVQPPIDDEFGFTLVVESEGIRATYRDIVRYDAVANGMTAQYDVNDVDWNGRTRNIVVNVEAGLVPVTLYEGSVFLEDLAAGTETAEVDLMLLPTTAPPTVPGDVFEELEGRIDVRFKDGEGPDETGQLFLTRTSSLCLGVQ